MSEASAIHRLTKAKGGISPQARRHNDMRKVSLQLAPELKRLAGTQPLTVLALPVLFVIHWGLAWTVSHTNALIVFIAALSVGQLTIHSAGALVHETAHKLIFRGRRSKLLFDLGLEFILSSYAKQLTYQHEHISSHHPHLGNYELDYEHEDICAFQARQTLKARSPRAQRFLTVFTLILHALPLGFLLGELVLPRLNARLSGRPVRDITRQIGATRPSRSEVCLFVAVSLLSNAIMLTLCGLLGLLYHLWSLSLFLGKMGISNLGQSLSEHAGSDERHPTRSTYGRMNWILFNTGYHSEHHTFPNVPWTRLPTLHKMAPGVFTNKAERSYFGYWWEHVRNDFTASRRTPLHDEDNSARCGATA